MQPPEQPPWQSRLVGFVTIAASLAALGWWDLPGFIVVAVTGTAISLAIWNRLSESPDSFAVLSLKIVGIIGWMVLLIGGIVLILEWVSPFWLAMLSVAAYFAIHFAAIERFGRWGAPEVDTGTEGTDD